MEKDIQEKEFSESKTVWGESSIGLIIIGNWPDRQELFLHCRLSRLREISDNVPGEMVKWYAKKQRENLPVWAEGEKGSGISCFLFWNWNLSPVASSFL